MDKSCLRCVHVIPNDISSKKCYQYYEGEGVHWIYTFDAEPCAKSCKFYNPGDNNELKEEEQSE